MSTKTAIQTRKNGGQAAAKIQLKYRLLGHSGLRVSEAALGAMTFGEDWGWGTAKDELRKEFGRA